jgi:hypothetical protein
MKLSLSPSCRTQGSTFFWVLSAFTGFAVLLVLFQVLGGRAGDVVDPRAPERLANKEEIVKAQNDLLQKMGMTQAASKHAVYEKALTFLKERKSVPSSQTVPPVMPAAAPAAPAAAN